MAKGYRVEEIREKLISVLKDSDSGISGIEISKKINVSRITMTKYLKVFAAEGLLRQKNIGNVTLWFLEPGQESFDFPDDYFKITSRYLELLVKGNEEEIYSLIRNCLNSGALINRIIIEVIYPAIDHIRELFDSGKIGSAEQNLLRNITSKSLSIFNQVPVVLDSKKNVVVIAADPESILISESASASYHSDGWNVSHLGDMSYAIDVLFDLDFQKLVRKIWKKKSGILLVVIFSQTSEGLSFFADSINPNKTKSDKQIKLALCGKISKKTKINSDLLSDNIGDVLQWSNTISQNIK
uniref:Putative transcriptional regulator n=1 Tax=uncultured marine thaumarchaeote KM3_70_D10 TaxID=1456253 RepID=A0A075HM83_9ARCH|nr:putative transcriptional regulator [uncultured marine thaumarchaeote KM3_70_D10]